MLQYVGVNFKKLLGRATERTLVSVWCSVVQCGAVWCGMVQSIAVCIAVCCSVLLCIAVQFAVC